LKTAEWTKTEDVVAICFEGYNTPVGPVPSRTTGLQTVDIPGSKRLLARWFAVWPRRKARLTTSH
jgi:hypothetical protein